MMARAVPMKVLLRLFRLGTLSITAAVVGCFYSGCFYPPMRPRGAPSPAITVDKPFDLVWDATHKVITVNGYRVVTEEPGSGLIETQTSGGFTLKDADCGQLRSVANKYAAEPGIDATVVYNFYVKPAGDEATAVTVQGTFDAPLQIPLRPTTDVQCFSRGVQERRLLKEIAAASAQEHRPVFTQSTIK
jgi:hypothetical protein